MPSPAYSSCPSYASSASVRRTSALLVSARAYRRPEAGVCGFAGSLMYHIGSGAALNVSKML